MGHTIFLLFYLEKVSKGDQNSKISHIWKEYRIFIFHPILICFFAVEWMVLSAVGSMSTFSSIFYGTTPFFFFKVKSYFNGLHSNINSHLILCKNPASLICFRLVLLKKILTMENNHIRKANTIVNSSHGPLYQVTDKLTN